MKIEKKNPEWICIVATNREQKSSKWCCVPVKRILIRILYQCEGVEACSKIPGNIFTIFTQKFFPAEDNAKKTFCCEQL